VYGVYDFLEKQFGYKYFDSYLYTIEKGVENKKLIDFDVKFIPSIEYRARSYGFQNISYKKIDEMYDWRMRMSVGERSMVIAKSNNNDWHNFFDWCEAVKGVYALRLTEEEFNKLREEWSNLPEL
jgi:hypothetical protein